MTAFKDGINLLYLDCAEILQVSSVHVNLLWEAISRGNDFQVKVKLVNANDSLKKVLKVLDLYEYFLGHDEDKKASDNLSGTVKTEVSSKSLKLEFTTESISVAQALAQLKQFLKSLNLSREHIIEIETLFYEVSTNIRMHSGMDKKEKMKFEAVTSSKGTIMTFIDSGIEFDLNKVDISYNPIRYMSNKSISGLGLVMIRRMSDNLSYKRENNKNILTLEKYWK